uniref:deoxyribonuclease IV n=1 Tax=Anaerovibrio slackiae TaxID=2652309 RepID=UPI0038696C09
MAGKGSAIGGRFEELADIISRVPDNANLGVCLDTCHIHDGGYAIAEEPDAVVREFDRIIGLDRLKAIHLNDSLTPFSSHKDRHAKIGEGSLGVDAIVRVINHPLLRDLPFILETPNDNDGYRQEIALLRSQYL